MADEIRFRVVLEGLDEAGRDVDRFRGTLRGAQPRGGAGARAPSRGPAARGARAPGRAAGTARGASAGRGAQAAGAAKGLGAAAAAATVAVAIAAAIKQTLQPALSTITTGLLAEFRAEREKLGAPGKAAQTAEGIAEPFFALGLKPSQRQLQQIQLAEEQAQRRIAEGNVDIRRFAGRRAMNALENSQFGQSLMEDFREGVMGSGRR